MNRRQFLQLAAGAGAAAAQTKRPLNFIFILVDDWGWTDLGCYGSKSYDTPNIDRLATQGMRFTGAYAACPVCSPTRASVITGKYPARLHLTDWIPGRRQWPTAKLLVPQFRQELPLAEITLAEALKPAGYVSASIGKWHLGAEGFSPLEQGFHRNVGGTLRGSPKSYFGPFDLPGLEGGPEGEYLTDRLTLEAEKFIEANRDRPFFLYLPEFAVHLPLQGRKDLVAKYETRLKSAGTQNNPIYAALVESVDEAVGRLMKKLEDLKIAGRTVVILTSDNGGLRFEGTRKDPITSNAPLRAGKGHLYEGGIREPLIVRWPGVVKPGSVCHETISSIDYFPTILEAAGLKPPQPVDGISLMPLLTGKRGLSREAVYWHYPHYSNQGGPPGGAVRKGDYKLIEFYEDGRLELFNLKNDLGERRNLARKEPRKAAELHGLLKRWRESVSAAMPKVNPNFDAAKADQGLTGVEPATPE
ncbi:MAG TPA: sulfatase [Bryobacteraceae bacterium]|jgi:arylsulfatase A-like enzyme|nr:sulfatase [Bryobacteraceae bacterium]